mgnify:CR=1 FL=1
MLQDKARFRVGKVFISCVTPQMAELKIDETLKSKGKEYICISTARTVNTANSDADYQKIMNNSLLNTTDGMPLIWCARLWGLKNVKRTMGPALFNSILSSGKPYRHFLIGDTIETLTEVTKHYTCKYGARIVGTVSPPFCRVDEFDYECYAEMINSAKADIVWVSMTAPKQDFFSAKILPLLDNGKVCIGVGAAFRYNLKGYKEPNKLVQNLGLTSFVLRGIKFSTIKKLFAIGLGILPCMVNIVYRRLIGKKYYE